MEICHESKEIWQTLFTQYNLVSVQMDVHKYMHVQVYLHKKQYYVCMHTDI